jgi:chromosome segregation protein
LAITLPTNRNERTDVLRRLVAEKKRALREIEDARLRAERLLPELTHMRAPAASAELEAKNAALEVATREKAQADARLALATRVEEAERENDSYAAHLAALLEHGTALGLQEGHCPLCDAFRSTEEFNKAVANARSRLAAGGENLAHAAAAVREARAAVDVPNLALANAQNGVTEFESRRILSEQELASVQEVYDRHSFNAAAMDVESAQQRLLGEQEKLAQIERALFILDASSAVDRISSLEARIVSLRNNADQEAAKLAECEKAVEAAQQIDSSAKTVANQILTEQFDTVMPLLKELYRRLRPHADWIEIESDFGGKVRGSLNFTVGDGHNIQFLFSSGERRAAGLAFLLAIHLSRKWCNWQSLLLDDPVQHIDDYRALNLVEVLAAIRRTGRQVIVAVEDTALADVLCRRLRSSVEEIGRRFELRTSKSGTAEIASTNDVYPMPREVLRPAQAS